MVTSMAKLWQLSQTSHHDSSSVSRQFVALVTPPGRA